MKSCKNGPEILLWRGNAVKGNSWRLLKALIRGKKQQTVLIGSADRWLCFSSALPAAPSQPPGLVLLCDPQTRPTAAKLHCSTSSDQFKPPQHHCVTQAVKWLLCVREYVRENTECIKCSASELQLGTQWVKNVLFNLYIQLPNIWYALHRQR